MNFLGLIIGYALGSLSPAYFLGKLLKGIDIRQHGDGNAGGLNAYNVLGAWPALVTVIFDLFKGLVSMYIASLLGAGSIFVHLAGLTAVLGHVFPFYLGFRGGKGIGTSMGILFYYLYLMLRNQWLSLPWLLGYVGMVILLFFIVKRKEIVGLISLPLLLGLIFLSSPLRPVTLFAALLVLYIFLMNFYLNIYRKKPAVQQVS
ncbi:MAG: glycerol-3-phosphate acyltransferase [Candidatus Aminicenantales bacterium]